MNVKRNTLLAIVALSAFAAPSFADVIRENGSLETYIEVNTAPEVTAHFDLGVPANGIGVRSAGDAYENITNFTGSGATNGGAASISGVLTTKYLADDLNVGASNVGYSVTRQDWCVANFAATAVTARMRTRWHMDNGSNAPGSYISGFSFTATAIPSGVTCYNYDNVTQIFAIPAAKIWMGITFDNSGAAGTTAAQLNNLGMGLFDPPINGTSADEDFLTSAASVGNVNNPAGATRISPFAGNPAADYGWRISPEPSSLALLGLGVIGLIRRRKTR